MKYINPRITDRTNSRLVAKKLISIGVSWIPVELVGVSIVSTDESSIVGSDAHSIYNVAAISSACLQSNN